MPAHQAVYLLSLHHIKTIQMTDNHALYLLSSCTNHAPTPRYYTHDLHQSAAAGMIHDPPFHSILQHGSAWCGLGRVCVSRVAILKKAALRILGPAT